MSRLKIFGITITLLLIGGLPLFAQRISPMAYSIGSPVNYVRTWDAKMPTTNPYLLHVGNTPAQAVMTTQYLDGLGRPIQTVVKDITPLGREQFKYLPFAANATGSNTHLGDGLFKTNPFQQDSAFYADATNSPIKGQGETYFYGQTLFEASPLNRPLTALAPGNSWVGASRGVSTQYLINTVSDSVRIWNSGATPSTAPTSTLTYPAGELYKNVVVDEGGKQVVEYKDKEGHVVLKKVQLAGTPGTAHMGWLCTYYVYDDLGNLTFVLQPKAVDLLLQSGSWTISNAIRDELCFYYGYDSRNRMNVKKVPGAGEVYMVYDARDRLVMTQDANLRSGSKWLVTLYDNLNRPVETGLANNSATGLDNKDFAAHGSSASVSTAYPFAYGSTPSSGYESLTETGYDNYDNIPTASGLSGTLVTTNITANFLANYNAAPYYEQPITQSLAVRGLPTWTKTKVLGTTADYLYSVTIYDEKGRAIQQKSTNISGGTDIATTQYDFSGKVLRTHVSHGKGGTNANTYQLLTKLTYDNGGRVTAITKKVSSTTTPTTTDKTIAQMSYDELGQLKGKTLGNSLESLSYDYNIRGWMLGANRDYAKSNATGHYFGFDLGYDKTGVAPSTGSSLGSYAASQYNGNITGTVWKSAGDLAIRKYDFTFDALNRLTGADFNQYTGGFNKNAGIDFSVSGLSYDANGNIGTMNQKGWTITGSKTIDSLIYTYRFNGSDATNKLLNVIDLKNDTLTKLGDFRSSSNYMKSLSQTKTEANKANYTDYVYDVNGNLTQDLNKDIAAGGIVYNHLNLPSQITVAGKGTIQYVYDATGNKLKKITTEGSKVTTTLYMLGTYVNDTLLFLPQEDGRLRLSTDTAQKFVCDYFLKDHLGNVRSMITEEQNQDTYPAATMELVDSTQNKSYYNNIDATRWAVSNITNYPTDNTYSNPNGSVAKVNGSGNKIGPSLVLKVMAGDHFNLRVSDWYKKNGVTPGTPYNPVNDLISALANGLGSVAGVKGSASQLLSAPSVSNGATSFYSSHNTADSTTKPKAFLNWVLFDEQFNYVSSSSGFEQVGGDNGTSVTVHTKSNLPIDKNGYLYVYVSNETPNIDVFFDNLQVTHIRGPLLEETHYYPFGLQMAGISSKAAGNKEANKRFQGQDFAHQEFSDGSGLEMYEFKYRMDDPQTGRFWQVDPLSEKYNYNSTYAFSENRVVNARELEGLEAVDAYKTVFEDGSEYMTISKRNPLDAIPSLGTTGTLWHLNYISDKGKVKSYEVYESEPEKVSSGIPQFQIFGSGDGSSSYGSEVDYSRPLYSFNLSKGGDAAEILDLIMLFTKFPTRDGMPKNLGEYLNDSYPGLIYKVAPKVVQAFKKYRPDTVYTISTSNDTTKDGYLNIKAIEIDDNGNTIDTIYSPPTNSTEKHKIVPNKDYHKYDNFDKKAERKKIDKGTVQ